MFADLKESIKTLSEELAKDRRERREAAQTDKAKLEADLRRLKEEKVEAEIDRDKRKEENDRRIREVEHKVGLEKQRQAFEVEQARREAILEVKEQNLAADKARFEEQMGFMMKRFEDETKYLKEMFEAVINRLPNIDLGGSIADLPSRRRAEEKASGE